MATLVSHGTDGRSKELNPETALRYAWIGYLAMLACPFFLFVYVMWFWLEQGLRQNVNFADRWFYISVIYMLVVPTASFFVRSRFFKGYWTGECVSPRNYLKGMFTVWIALEAGGLLSLAGCLFSRSLLPNMLPSLAAFMMYVVLWPNGRAMICKGRGASDDPERYEEPR